MSGQFVVLARYFEYYVIVFVYNEVVEMVKKNTKDKKQKVNKKRKIILLISILLFIVVLVVVGIMVYSRERVPELTSLEVFGQKVEVKKGKRVYVIDLKEGNILYKNGSVLPSIVPEFENGAQASFGSMSVKPGETEAEMYLSFGHDSTDSTYYDYYIKVYLEKPIGEKELTD